MMLNGVFMAKIRSKTVVVCDAGPLIHLDEVGCLRDVSTLYIKDSLLQGVMSKIMQDHS